MSLIRCPDCGKEISDTAYTCPHCGKSFRAVVRLGCDYRSRTTICGWPLLHVATGFDPLTGRKRIARGIIAVGDVAVGVLAMGGGAIGIIAIGGAAIGLLALGGGAVGVLLALGGVAIGGIALGGAAIGVVALGGGAVGYYAFGGGAWGVHAISALSQDPAAVEFFREWLGDWVTRLVRQP